MPTAQTAPEVERYLELFAKRQAPAEPSWLSEMRRAAMDRFVEHGFPVTSEEEWRFTNVAPIARTVFSPAPVARAKTCAVDSVPGETTIVLVDGRFAPELSSLAGAGKGVHAGGLAEAIAKTPERIRAHLGKIAPFEAHPFTALNTALFEDGAFLWVDEESLVERPLRIVHVATASAQPSMCHPRLLVILGAGSQARLIETFASTGEGASFTNGVTEIALGAGAVLDHYKFQQESTATYHVQRSEFSLAANAALRSHSFATGAALARNDINVLLGGEGADCILNGLYVVEGTQHVDHHTGIDHAKPHCTSHELFKGILAGRSTGVFNGRIIVRKDAQKTDSKQTNKNLLLSEDALVQTNPQLEIYADDVKCTHGATIGQMDENALFYLRSRGIPREEAGAILTYAFAAEIVSQVKVEGLRRSLEAMLAARFQGAGGTIA